MNVGQIAHIIDAEVTFGRTPWKRRLNEQAIETLRACLEDKKNWDSDAIQCKNCGIIVSRVLVPQGCIYCGYPGMTTSLVLEKEK